MWIADNWKDYEVIDCSKGEKLERWGDYILVRPDPQVIWDTPKNDYGWKHRNGHYHRSKKGGGEWEFFDLPQQWQIHYGSLKHCIRLWFNAKTKDTVFAVSFVFFWYVIERLTSRCSAVNNVYKSGENPDKQGVYINWSSSAQDHLWGK